jgi:hypothetical protein
MSINVSPGRCDVVLSNERKGGLFSHFVSTYVGIKSWDSSVGMATGYGLDVRGSNPGGAGNFSLHHRIQTGSGAHLA